MLLHKTIYIDMWCVLQFGSFRNLTENNTLPQVILTFLYWSKLYQIGWHTTYMNTYNEPAGECSQKYLLRKLWLTFFKQICNAFNFAVALLILIKKMRFFVVYLKNCDQKWRWQLYKPAVFLRTPVFQDTSQKLWL